VFSRSRKRLITDNNYPLGKNWILLIIPIYAKVSK
jgi:hypothetical protein